MRKESAIILLKKVQELFLDVLFPISCLGCGQGQDWLCDDCMPAASNNSDQVCGICEKVGTPNGRTCIPCKRRSALDGLLVCASYKDRVVSKMIHSFKYKFIPDIHLALGKIMVKKILFSSISLPDILIPIPLHLKRLRWRGFNQSELLTKYLSENLTPGFEISMQGDILIRKRNTRSQMKLKNYHERSKNIFGAFYAKKSPILEGKSIFLIDDVATTGSTLSECAKILKKAGAKEVFAIVVARQEMK